MPKKFEESSNRAVVDYKIKNELIGKLKHRFSTFGYQQVHTPTFEDYDMYASIQQTVNKDEMVKVIDRSGKVLVLRPDGTIPITRLTAANRAINGSEQRLFYVFNVYRQTESENTNKESTQAGVELFGNKQPEADAEIIALAVHTLKDIGFHNFKIEIGHAGLFRELVEQADVSIEQLEQLQELIQSKNMVEMEPFLKKLELPAALQDALYAIPLLYGSPQMVLEETKSIIQNERMKEIFNNLTVVVEILKDYDVLDSISLNLGLINNMDYYTDIIFQGFVENIGKPVLMGGRYDQLGEQFGKSMPAIGFAYEVDFLLDAVRQHQLIQRKQEEKILHIYYDPYRRRDAFIAGETLRDSGYAIILDKMSDSGQQSEGIYFTKNEDFIQLASVRESFSTQESLLAILGNTGWRCHSWKI